MARTDSHLVIMTGGVGGGFWPMSTIDCLKQFINVLGIDRSLIQLTHDRFAGVAPSDNMWIVTNQKYISLVHGQLPEMPPNHILSELYRRSTTPCIAYVSWRIRKENPKTNIVVSPSDHIVTNEAELKRVISNCLRFTAETDAVVTLGVKPTRPETSYDYIQANLPTASAYNREIYRIDQFRERPDLPATEQYIKQNNFFQNTGVFIRSASTIVSAFRIYQPGIARIFEYIMDVSDTADEQRVIDEVYPKCGNVSVNCAIMERAEEMFVCPADFGWSDLGTRGSLLAQAQHDIYDNTVIGNGVHLSDNKNCIVHTTEGRKVVIQGLDDYIVAEQDSKLLICRLSEEQCLKQFTREG